MIIRIVTMLLLSFFISTEVFAKTIQCKEPKSTLPTVVKEALKSTVTIYSEIALEEVHHGKKTASISTTGSGFIADTSGNIVMSGHRIASFLNVEHPYPQRHIVILHDCREYKATLVAVGGDGREGVDAVILKIVNPPKDLIPIPRNESIIPHDDVYVMGTPYGVMNTVYEGTLAGSHINNSPDFVYAYINLQDGISGGPLITKRGDMIGTAQGTGVVLVYGSEIPVSFFVSTKSLNNFLSKHSL